MMTLTNENTRVSALVHYGVWIERISVMCKDHVDSRGSLRLGLELFQNCFANKFQWQEIPFDQV